MSAASSILNLKISADTSHPFKNRTMKQFSYRVGQLHPFALAVCDSLILPLAQVVPHLKFTSQLIPLLGLVSPSLVFSWCFPEVNWVQAATYAQPSYSR